MTLGMDFTSQDFFRDPAAGLKGLRAAGAVVEVWLPIIGRVWMTTTQEMASRVLEESQVFTLRKDDGAVAGLRWWMPRIFFRVFTNNMLTVDEPDHTRLRGIVDEAFRRRAVLDMEPRIRAIADELAGDLFARGSPADLVTRYARMLPLSVICELLGLPLADRPKFMAWADRVTGVASSALGLLRVVPSLAAMKRYLERHLEYVRKVGGEGLIAELVRVEKEGARLSRDEMVPMVFLLLVAGHESTTHLISGSVFELAKNPGLRDWLAEDWSRADLALEEFLRFVSPVHFSKPRFVRQDSPYMLLVADVAAKHRVGMTDEQKELFGIDKLNVPRSSIPAVTHVDYSARVQTVHPETNPRFHRLLCRFRDRTGCPVLVNTSFNVRGEPIVCTPEDAFRCFMGTELDMLAIGNCILCKDEQLPSLRVDYKNAFAPD